MPESQNHSHPTPQEVQAKSSRPRGRFQGCIRPLDMAVTRYGDQSDPSDRLTDRFSQAILGPRGGFLVAIPGYVDYERREYCKAIECPIQRELEAQAPGSAACQAVRDRCLRACIHTTYEFHHWLMAQGYLLVRPERNA